MEYMARAPRVADVATMALSAQGTPPSILRCSSFRGLPLLQQQFGTMDLIGRMKFFLSLSPPSLSLSLSLSLDYQIWIKSEF